MSCKFSAFVCCWVLLASSLSADGAERRVPLLQPSQGQRPNDTAQENKTKLTIEENALLGGKSLKVELAPGDSFGNKGIGEKNWKQFIAVVFDAVNPTVKDVHLSFAVKHRRTTSFQTRVDIPITLKPGKNSFRLGIDEMSNVNESTPDLTAVTHWYLTIEESPPPALYFGDFWLVGDETQPAGATAGGEIRLSGTYKITGTIGGQYVNLTITPQATAVSPQAEALGKQAVPSVETDPARLTRLRAAKMPEISVPTMFDTPEADAILTALEVFPPDNAFNQVVSNWPVHRNSRQIVASIGVEKPLRYNPDMAFVIVPSSQKKIEVALGEYTSESDPGPYPVPDNMPIEGWPVSYHRDGNMPGISLLDVQMDKLGKGGDRHALVVDPVNRMLYEFYSARRTAAGWQALQASIFDLKTNALRTDGWTSSDAAGLPVFPAVVRYDELKRGAVEHAMRVTVRRSRRAYVHPATHYASRLEDESLPRMGERLRLRSDFDTSGCSPEVRTILNGLKKYGMFVADNGLEWAISVTPDPRIPNLHEELRKVKGSDFEVVTSE